MFSLIVTTVILSSLRCHSYGRNIGEAEIPQLFSEQDTNEVIENIPLSEMDPQLDNELLDLSYTLTAILQQPLGPEGIPLLYVEDSPVGSPGLPQDIMGAAPPKRSRYYRRYPWKRQNSRSRTRYEADNRYLCQPSREDVFKLLVALHETRAGNGGKSINFCNRRRSAGSVFTNIRFLGKKK